MPVSTRSQVSSNVQEKGHSGNTNHSLPLRNPHHGLREKMKELSLLYEQQKQARTVLPPATLENRFTTHPSVDLLGSNTKKQDNDDSSPQDPVPLRGTRTSSVCRARTEEVLKEIKFMPGREGATANVVSKRTVRRLSMNPRERENLDRNDDGRARNILVFVRVRPMAKKEKEVGSRSCVRIVNNREIYLTEFANENDYLRLKRLRGRHFTFDASFPDAASQQEVYSTTTADLVEAVLQGRNGSVFCYGATGAGKTYTMLGTFDNPGVMVLAIKDLFNKIRQRSYNGNQTVHLSYLEVYNETVRDLLSPGRPLVLREDKQGIVAAGLTQYKAYSTDEVMTLLLRGNQNRTTEPTRVNETSSRSHAILQVMVDYQALDANMNVIRHVGKLSLIDLAGSERAIATDQRTARSIEGANINRSLLALSSCINALVEGKKHIPYRNSKLTQLLKDSLGGSCKAAMIANISPSNLSFGETQNTLHWADRAKHIRSKVCDPCEETMGLPESETKKAELLLEVQKENQELRAQLARQQQKILTLQVQSLAAQTSPTPPSAANSFPTPPTSARHNEKRRPRASLFSGACFTPEQKKKGMDDLLIRELQKTVRILETEIEKMKRDHALQLKQKDDHIRNLARKDETGPVTAGINRVITRATLQQKEPSAGDLKSPNHRFKSPVTITKKRTFWDITTTNSPSVTTLNRRKTRSNAVPESLIAAPSMLLQPGFARKRAEAPKR
ncbi:hypothetical protein MLD38_030092 [Melastoma candidum]|uniref:Uncharacterized protein n=1 Tax=Melastoma candidum TaxID=119954 RepID=A0ACB9MKS7_9MYRT|nr:hypothetical protein MLD38_030092 [Melastoma candidum]